MTQGRIERRLAAILAADVAGYSRLIGVDEEGTLMALRALRRELIDPAIAEHRGRIVKTTGDGMLVEFASVLDALRCAIARVSSFAQSRIISIFRRHLKRSETRVEIGNPFFRFGLGPADRYILLDYGRLSGGVLGFCRYSDSEKQIE